MRRLHRKWIVNSSAAHCVATADVMQHGRWVNQGLEVIEQERRVAGGYTGSSGHQKRGTNGRSAYN